MATVILVNTPQFKTQKVEWHKKSDLWLPAEGSLIPPENNFAMNLKMVNI